MPFFLFVQGLYHLLPSCFFLFFPVRSGTVTSFTLMLFFCSFRDRKISYLDAFFLFVQELYHLSPRICLFCFCFVVVGFCSLRNCSISRFDFVVVLFAQELHHLSSRFCLCVAVFSFRNSTISHLDFCSPFRNCTVSYLGTFFLCLGHVVFYFDFFPARISSSFFACINPCLCLFSYFFVINTRANLYQRRYLATKRHQAEKDDSLFSSRVRIQD